MADLSPSVSASDIQQQWRDDNSNGDGDGVDDGTTSDIKLVELILLYGAPFSGKTRYCEKYILSLHHYISYYSLFDISYIYRAT